MKFLVLVLENVKSKANYIFLNGDNGKIYKYKRFNIIYYLIIINNGNYIFFVLRYKDYAYNMYYINIIIKTLINYENTW